MSDIESLEQEEDINQFDNQSCCCQNDQSKRPIYEYDDISSDEEELDQSSLENFILYLQQNPTDGDMIHELVVLLKKHNYLELARNLNMVGISQCPSNDEMFYFMKKYGCGENSTMINTIRNIWFNTPKYYTDDWLTINLVNKDKSYLDLGEIQEKPSIIQSLPDAVANISETKEFTIFRKFNLEKFTIYHVNMFCVYTPNIEASLWVSTEDRITRLQHKLPRSQIQYKFNSLNLDKIHIGVKGQSQNSGGQIRISHMSLTKIGNHELVSLLVPNNKLIRKLACNLPIVVSMQAIESQKDGLRETLDSLMPYVDHVNIYLINWTTNAILLFFKNNSKISIYRNEEKIDVHDSMIQQNNQGILHWVNQVVGYHFLVTPGLIYHEDYVPMMISKIQQYNFRVVVGLKGVQINNQTNFESLDKSCNTISPFMGINQDVKCHLLSSDTMAYFTGGFIISDNKITKKIEIDIGIQGQKQKIPFICIERLTSLVSINKTNGYINEFIANAEDNKILKNSLPWKFN